MSGPLSPTELQEILGFTTDLARKAGALILEGSDAIRRAPGPGSVGEKKNAVDLVTEYDVRVEELVRDEIARAYPHFQFIGEESYSSGTRPPLTDSPTFCVDPIDGTTNFVHGFPYACISIGLIDHRVPVLGVIYNPFLEHLYTGIRNAGSFLHAHTPALTGKDSTTTSSGIGTPQRLPLAPASGRPLPALAGALIAVEWGSDRAQDPIRRKADSFSRLAGAPPHGVMAHSLRSVGSAALNFALVAQGALDMYWEIGCWPWDVCAGIVIAQEAGGFVTGSKDVQHDGVVTEAILTGRRYLVIRGVAGTSEESSLDVQKRIAREFYDTVEDIPLDE